MIRVGSEFLSNDDVRPMNRQDRQKSAPNRRKPMPVGKIVDLLISYVPTLGRHQICQRLATTKSSSPFNNCILGC